MASYLDQSIDSLSQSIALLESLPFQQTDIFSRAALASEDWFETNVIRDAESHETALFTSAPSRKEQILLEYEDDGREKVVTRRKGPGVSSRKDGEEIEGGDDPVGAINAALRLLKIYPLPQYTAKIQSLKDEYQERVASIEQAEADLRSTADLRQEELLEEIRALEDQIRLEQEQIREVEERHRKREKELRETLRKKELSDREKEKARRATEEAEIRARGGASAGGTRGGEGRVRSARQTYLEEKLQEQRKRVEERSRASVAGVTPGKVTHSSVKDETPVKEMSTPRKASTPGSSRKTSTPLSTPKPTFTPRYSEGRSQTPTSNDKRPTRSTPRRQSSSSLNATPQSSRRVSGSPFQVAGSSSFIDAPTLSLFSSHIWESYGDVLRPWKRQLSAADGLPETLSVVELALSKATVIDSPLSPGSIASYSTQDQDEGEPGPLSPEAFLQLQLVRWTLQAVLGRPVDGDGKSPSLDFVVAIDRAKPTMTPQPMLPMNVLKRYLSATVAQRNWSEALATSAIYKLMSNQVVKIVRRHSVVSGQAVSGPLLKLAE